MKNGNKEREREEEGEGEGDATHFYIKTCGLLGVLQLQLQIFTRNAIKKALGGDSGPGDDGNNDD